MEKSVRINGLDYPLVMVSDDWRYRDGGPCGVDVSGGNLYGLEVDNDEE